MRRFVVRFVQMIFGLAVCALGIVFTLNARIGYGPWDILHSGISLISGLTIGRASILVGVVIGLAVWIRAEKFGLGSICNMVIIGLMEDAILASGIIPIADNFWLGVVMLIIGLFGMALGTYFYIAAGFGAGPRDSLMVVATRLTKLPVGVVRSSIEFISAFIGWMLGGLVGIGSIIYVLAIGACMQIIFRFFHFVPAEVKHETLWETITSLRSKSS